MSLKIPRSPRPGEPVTSDWARAVTDALRAMQIAEGTGIHITRTATGLIVSAVPQKQPQNITLAAGITYPYASWCAFGFMPSVAQTAAGERCIRLTLHNLYFASPTYGKLVSASGASDDRTAYPYSENACIDLTQTGDHAAESYIAAEIDASAAAGPDGAQSIPVALAEKHAWFDCFSTRNESKSGLCRIPLYKIRYSVKEGTCTITADYCHGANPGFI